MTWRPNAGVEIAAARAAMLDRVRQFFRDSGVLEVCTPALVSRTATDPNIESLATRCGDREVFLHTSPEHAMKRLLAAGYPDIYQICSVYRDHETGRHHLPEFTMVEWYRRGFTLQAMLDETVRFATEMFTKTTLGPAACQSYAQAFAGALAFDPLQADVDTLAGAVDADSELRDSLGEDRDGWLDLIMATRVAPTFPADRLTAIFHYPASQAALARLCPEDGRVADRFELYLGPLELANGFVELTDADEQHDRFRSDQEKRQEAGRTVHAIDDKLISAMHAGLPECAGVALGLDRVLMIDEGRGDVRDVTTFTPAANYGD